LNPTRRVTVLLIGIAISGLFLWIAGRDVHIGDILQSMRQTNLIAVLPFTFCLLIFYLVRTYRWKVLLSPVSNVTTRELLGPVLIGYGGNFILPFQLGEVARTVAAIDRTRLSFMPIAFSILVERVFDFVVILAALSVALLAHDGLPAFVATFGIGVGVAVGLAIALIALFVTRTERTLETLKTATAFLPHKMHMEVVNQLRVGATGLESFRSPRVLLIAAVTSIVQWWFIALCIWISLLAINLVVPITIILLILALIVLGSSIPTAPGYLGSFQAGYVIGIEAMHGDPSQAITASIFYHAIYAVSALLLGAFALKRSGLDWTTLTNLGNKNAKRPVSGK
jgi:hypothetical protein